MRRSVDCNRTGFTLIEIVVALALAGGALLLASAILSVTSQLAGTVQVGVERADARHGSERLARRLVGQTTWPTANDPAPGGSATELRFVSGCDTPEGWQQRCIVQFDRSETSGVTGFRLILDGRVAQQLFPADTVLEFIYLRSAAHGGTWSAQWIDPATIPVAIGIVFSRDTLILRTGERG